MPGCVTVKVRAPPQSSLADLRISQRGRILSVLMPMFSAARLRARCRTRIMLQAIFFDPNLVRRHELVEDEICARDVNDVLRLVVAPCRSRMLQTAISAARHAVFYQFYYSPNGRRIEPIPRAAHRNGSRHSTARRCGDYQGCGHRTYGRIHGSLDHCPYPKYEHPSLYPGGILV
jgi:hypothetical protein